MAWLQKLACRTLQGAVGHIAARSEGTHMRQAEHDIIQDTVPSLTACLDAVLQPLHGRQAQLGPKGAQEMTDCEQQRAVV